MATFVGPNLEDFPGLWRIRHNCAGDLLLLQPMTKGSNSAPLPPTGTPSGYFSHKLCEFYPPTRLTFRSSVGTNRILGTVSPKLSLRSGRRKKSQFVGTVYLQFCFIVIRPPLSATSCRRNTISGRISIKWLQLNYVDSVDTIALPG